MLTQYDISIERAALATAAAWAGGALAVGARGFALRRLPLLVTIAALALLVVTLGDILPDARALCSWPVVLAGVASGAGLLWLVSRFVHPVCPACAGPSPVQEKLDGASRLLMAALSVHCLLDGVAVALPGADAGHTDAAMLGAVLLHKVPEGLALALLLLGAGRTPRAAFALTALTESATLLGGIVGAGLAHRVTPAALGFLLAHVGGGFLYLVGMTASAARHAAVPLSNADALDREPAHRL